MKTKTFSKRFKNLDVKKLWNTWTEVNSWNTWQDDLEFAKMEGDFTEGKTFILRPKGGPNVKIQLLKVVPQQQFIDLTVFPLAKMYGDHQFILHDNKEVEIKTTMSIEGPLAFLWNNLVMNDIVAKLESQTDALVKKSQE